MNKKGFTIKLDENLWKEFSIECIRKGRTKTEILEDIIRDFVKKR